MFIEESDVIPILKELIKIKTENPPGKTIDAALYIKQLFSEIGISCRIQEYAEDKANVIAEYGDQSSTIMLTGHLDTVPIGERQKWEHDPFGAIEEEGRIYGRGATDMKGAVAAYVAILRKLKENKISLNKKIIFLGTSDEEIGMDGAVAAKKEGVMDNCEFVIIGEPTELKLGIAEKGTLWIKLKVRGKSAHGSTPHLGISAIEAASRLIQKMKAIVPDFEHEILGKSSLNIGKINGGTLINVVPEFCQFECDIRLVADHLREETKKKINDLISNFNDKEEAKASFEILHEIPAIELKEKTDFFTVIEDRTKQIGTDEIIGVNYGTDGAMLVPEKNIPFIIIGPGKLDQLHVTDEYTEKEEVIQYANLIYEALIEAFKS